MLGLKVEAEAGLIARVGVVQGSIPTRGATLFSALSDMIEMFQVKEHMHM